MLSIQRSSHEKVLFYENLGFFSQGFHQFGVDSHKNDDEPHTVLIDARSINLYASQSSSLSVGRLRFVPTLKSVADLPEKHTPNAYLEQNSQNSREAIRASVAGLPSPFLSSPRSASFRSVHVALLRFAKRVPAACVGVESAHKLWCDCPARGSHVGSLHGK